MSHERVFFAEDESGNLRRWFPPSTTQVDAYGLALMMIREGASDPQRVAAEALAKFKHE